MYLQDFLQPYTSGQGGVGPNDARGESSCQKMTPCSSHVPLLLTEQSTTRSKTPLKPVVSAPASDRCTPDYAEEGVDVEHASIDIGKATFPRSSRVTSTSTIHTTFLVDEYLVPIKIKNIPVNYYAFFMLVFII